MKMRADVWAGALTALMVAAGAEAEQRVEQRRSAPRDGIVEIENAIGTVVVTGWNKDEITVKGELSEGGEGLVVRSRGNRTVIEVDVSGNPHSVTARLEINVPMASTVKVETFAAAITILDVAGPVQAETVEGSISVKGTSKQVEAETVNGSVEVEAPATDVKAESVNGSVTVRGSRGHLRASTVNGSLHVEGGSFLSASLETVSGEIRFAGTVADQGALEAETVSGSVELKLPATIAATFSVTSFSGSITNELGPPAERTSRHHPEKELRFSLGDGGARIDVETLSGSVALRK